jgi:hypothetical protein
MNDRGRRFTAAFVLVSACIAMPRPARATWPVFRDWSFEFALGKSATVPTGEPVESGAAGRIGLMRLFGEHWGLGVSMTGAQRNGEVTDSTHVDTFLIGTAISVRWMPFGNHAGPGILNVRAGGGPAFVEAEETIEPTQRVETTDRGFAAFIGAGYLISFGREVSVGLEMEMTWLAHVTPDARFLASHVVVAWHL